jgi:hypothetical protein
MKKSPAPQGLAICFVVLFVAGIGGLVIFAPIIAAIIFVVLVSARALCVVSRNGGWKGFVTFVKDMLFSW